MSTDVGTLSPMLTADAPRVTTRTADEELLDAARTLLDSGPVNFKISTRVPAEELGPIRQHVYTLLCRKKLPARLRRLRIPPSPAMQQGFFDGWNRAIKECRTPDDQLLVMPKNRTYSDARVDIEIECRPADPTDSHRFELLQSVFGGYTEESDLAARLRASEEYGRHCERAMREATDLFHRTMKTNDDDG
jgi:hypothetical protein